MDTFPADTEELLLHSLTTGQTDVVVFRQLRFDELKYGDKGIHPLTPTVVTHKLFHYLHTKNAQLIPELTEILKEMESSGRIEELISDLNLLHTVLSLTLQGMTLSFPLVYTSYNYNKVFLFLKELYR
ncbi:hypothetical protein BCF53_12324 [Reinekea marinisedimentorum]|uniref:Extracellular solute-binding protein (Family 3) n=1 Tax=Reinekea marinisedimentorum TaxID=230495 RepID=A0A4R3HUC7_9GAMM|nr:hypothetical protein BCF53_12324 [Reinekea marinisedimentorum]